jgi:hypothetical protein
MIVYYQSQCLAYTARADQVVGESDPDESNRLAAQSGYSSNGKRMVDGRAVMLGAVYTPPPWKEFRDLVPGTSPPIYRNAGGVAFLHEMRSKSGNVRLVCFSAMPAMPNLISNDSISGAWAGQGYDIEIFDPGTFWRHPKNLSKPPPSLFNRSRNIISATRVFAGQLDPADPSHFTVRYERSNAAGTARRGTINGYLHDDDIVEIIVVEDGDN